MSQNPDQIRSEIERTRGELSSDVDQLTDQANPKNIARRKVEDVKQSAVGLKERVMGSDDSDTSVGDRVSDAQSSVRAKTQGNPLGAGLIAFGIGLLVGGLIPASPQEQQAAGRLKESAGPLKEQLTDTAKEVGQNLQGPAQDAVASVKDTATDAAETVRSQGQDAAENVQGRPLSPRIGCRTPAATAE